LAKRRLYKTKKEGEMPPIFKALASITAWTLFILGWLFIVWPTVMGIISGEMVAGPPPWQQIAGYLGGITSLALSVVCMKLRQMLE